MKPADAIGGYFELEHKKGEEYYSSLIKVNTGRNALEYILLARLYSKVYVPYYTCDVILEPFHRQGIEYEFYKINFNLEILRLPELNENEAVLYTNYFGLKTNYIEKLKQSVKNLIIDNAQAFFCENLLEIDTFYSPRKFFGLPDGGYVATTGSLDVHLPKDYSAERCSHLLIRLDEGAEAGYQAFKKNDNNLSGQQIKEMSELTHSLLCAIDYDSIRKRRTANFKILHAGLRNFNEFKWIDEAIIDGPMLYPFYCKDENLRKKLLNNKVFVATYWPNVFNWLDDTSLEYKLAKNIIPLPIDQRYQEKDLVKILEIIYSSI